ncbi:AMP-binding protein [Amorphus sp. 3PC139-8]|uniref:AMP-binding protein n=1 Tax=Amorphus sp. 3PC139-8 TaxID=2735676 RepID=UPI00345C7B00
MDTITDMSAKRAELMPDRPAFVDGVRGTLTFADVDERANRLAEALRGLGLNPGDRIAVLCLNRTDFFVLLFASLKAELVLVPLNWRQPPAELGPILARSGAKYLIHDRAFAEAATEIAEAGGVARIGMDPDLDAAHDLEALIAAASGKPCGPGRRGSDEVWYLLFTSGTTGEPKAVIYTFAMAWANAINYGQASDLTSRDVTVNYLPLFHTAGINLPTLPVFLAGGLSHVLPKFEPDAVLDLIERGELTHFFAVPAVYQALSLSERFATLSAQSVGFWGCGGAPLSAALIARFAERGIVVCNGMGMTETGPTVFLMDRAHAAEKIGSVGKAQILAEVRIVGDDDAAIIGEGEGELQVRGPGVTPGYFENDQATANAFTADGWLKSGDVARRDGDGYFYIVDRIKDMYISGGENVYPAEVERVLAAHEGVLEAIVVGVPDEKWGEVGHAFLLPRPGQTVEPDALRAWCRERLAAYKVPKHVSVVADFPRTAAGKVQKHVLKKEQA